jgi:flagellar hook-associated protein 3 FlgL
MRISSLSYFTASLPSMQDNQSQIARLSEQVANGLRMQSARDNPIDAEKALQLSDRVAARAQSLSNQQKAGLSLDLESTVLSEIRSTLNDARTLAVNSNASQDPTLQQRFADQMSGYYKHLKDLVNTQDSSGRYVFAGFRTDLTTNNPPFQHTQAYPSVAAPSPATNYIGTAYGSLVNPSGVRNVSVDTNRQIQVSDNLDTVIQSGSVNGTANGSTTDILQIIDQFAVTMSDPSVTNTQKETAIASTINSFTAALDRLSGVESRVAATQQELNNLTDTTNSQQTLEQNALSDLTQVDKTAAIVELQSRQTALQAAQQAYGQTSKLSLFSYL